MFTICGEALFDIFTEHSAKETLTNQPLLACAGGSPFNVAIGLARLGQNASLLTGLSNDFLGDRLHKVLNEESVNTQFITRKDTACTLGFVSHGSDGVPEYAFYGNGASDRVLNLDDVLVDLGDTQALHFGSYTTVTQPTADSFLALAQREKGKRFISYDPNIRPTVEPDMAIWRERFMQFAACANLIKISDEDLELLYPGSEPKQKAQEWLESGVDCIIVTQGSKGVLACTTSIEIEFPAQRVEVIDTVGAGDTFQAATLCALQQKQRLSTQTIAHITTQELQEVCRFAATAAAITCSRRGADLPTYQEVVAQL